MTEETFENIAHRLANIEGELIDFIDSGEDFSINTLIRFNSTIRAIDKLTYELEKI